jgi:hypothetical protein
MPIRHGGRNLRVRLEEPVVVALPVEELTYVPLPLVSSLVLTCSCSLSVIVLRRVVDQLVHQALTEEGPEDLETAATNLVPPLLNLVPPPIDLALLLEGTTIDRVLLLGITDRRTGRLERGNGRTRGRRRGRGTEVQGGIEMSTGRTSIGAEMRGGTIGGIPGRGIGMGEGMGGRGRGVGVGVLGGRGGGVRVRGTRNVGEEIEIVSISPRVAGTRRRRLDIGSNEK